MIILAGRWAHYAAISVNNTNSLRRRRCCLQAYRPLQQIVISTAQRYSVRQVIIIIIIINIFNVA